MPQIRASDTVAGMSFAWKPDDQTTSTNIVLTDDTVLQLPINAGTNYLVELYLLVNNAAANAQFKFALNAPATAAFNGFTFCSVASATAFTEAVQRTSAVPGTVTAVVTGAINGIVQCAGILTTGAAGVLKLQWSQAVSDAGLTMVARGSWLRLTVLQ